MSYTALYRKFRPKTFDEVKGQDHIVQTLKNQITAERIGHAYLFCGTRGTGKTSVAKIFAKAVNCESAKDGSPCMDCSTCEAIESGSAMNVVEIDAASNNGVENIRQIRDEIQYAPSVGRYTVYIIDEVHMLSIGAFNALLKTLEEPPAYVIFILATTEPHKIPITILSRCQRYDFKRISIETIVARLSELMEEEKVEVEPRAIEYIAKAADGSMRDALSLLDQCIAFYMGEALTYEKVLEVLGAVDNEVFSRLTRSVVDGDVVGAMQILDEIVMQGRELGQFVNDFIWYLRNLMLLKSSDNAENIIDMSKEHLDALKAEAEMVETPVIMRYIRILSELSAQIRYSSQKRVLIEIALIKMTKPTMQKDDASVINRLEQLEKAVAEGNVMAVKQPTQKTSQQAPTENKPVEQPAKPKYEKAVPEDVQHVVDNFQKILRVVPPKIKMAFNNVRFAVEGEKLLIIFPQGDVGYSLCNNRETVEMFKRIIGEETNKEVEIEMKELEATNRFEDYYQEVKKKVKMDIEEEDF